MLAHGGARAHVRAMRETQSVRGESESEREICVYLERERERVCVCVCVYPGVEGPECSPMAVT